MGNLVPYNAIWRTGVNANSTFAVNTLFEFGGTILEAGTYAVFTKPAPSQWEVFLYRKSDNWGAPAVWDPSLVAAIATVSSQQTERTMTSFSMNINEITLNGAHLEIRWENTLLAVPFSVPTDQMVMNSIEKTLNPAPTANDYYTAAVYLLSVDKDVKQALSYMDTAMEQIENLLFGN